jgi:hypothetical protein
MSVFAVGGNQARRHDEFFVHRNNCRFRAFFTDDFSVLRQSLRDDLIHIVITVSRQSSDKMHVGHRIGESFVFRVKIGVFFARNRIIRVAFGARIFVNDARFTVFLSGQSFKLGDARVKMLVNRS